MFRNAVEKHPDYNKSQTSNQKTPSSSSSNGFPGSNGNRMISSTGGLANSSILQPSAKPVVNSAIAQFDEASTVWKRKYSNGLDRTLSNENSFSEAIAFLDLPPSGQAGGLQDAVLIDEDDFENDEDLKPAFGPTPVAPKQPLNPRLSSPNPRRPPLSQTSTSSKIPWSSSPLDHHVAATIRSHAPTTTRVSTTADAKYPSLLETTSTNVTYPNLNNDLATLEHGELSPIAQPSKRRKLPWADKGKNSSTSKKGLNKYKWQPEAGGDFTPLPKNESKDKYPWNVTATTVKNEQKALRKQFKSRVISEKPDQEVAEANKKKKVAAVFLSDEQKKIASMVVDEEKSVFFTGSAGTGKSVLMREIISRLREKYKKEADRVAVTASTGLAACNIEGVTLHSFAGIGLGKEPAPELIKKVKKNPKAKARWQRTKVLIIDEVSMVDGVLWDKLEAIARGLRINGRAFGGIQLVVTGDFFQLPPVPEKNIPATFSFEANTWKTSIDHTILLSHVFRQRDPVFANMLNEMRVGKLTPKSIETFRKLSRPLHYLDEFSATELFPTRAEVDSANNSRMSKLSGKSYAFSAIDTGTVTDPVQRSRLLSNCMAPESLELKKGAQVMLIKNLEDALVNGSLGKVVAFMDETTWDYRHDIEDDDLDEPDENDEEAAARRLELKKKMYKTPNAKPGRLWPCVQFTLGDGTSRRILCQPEAWKVELPNGEVQAQRQQVPLILAWALSIHKAQGQTLERVKVDMGKIFEKGQAYVALSRATAQSGLQVLRFDPKKIMAHPKVNSFYTDLVTVEHAAAKSVSRLSASKYEQGFIDGYADEDEEEASYMYG